MSGVLVKRIVALQVPRSSHQVPVKTGKLSSVPLSPSEHQTGSSTSPVQKMGVEDAHLIP
jgi:hypothetical protein